MIRPLHPSLPPRPCSYTLFTEICDERGRKYNYIVGRVVWVAGLVALPFVGLCEKFISGEKTLANVIFQQKASETGIISGLCQLP